MWFGLACLTPLPRTVVLFLNLLESQATELLLAEQPPLDIHAADISGLTALHHACLGGSPAVIQALAARGAALDPSDVLGGARLLAIAAQVCAGDIMLCGGAF